MFAQKETERNFTTGSTLSPDQAPTLLHWRALYMFMPPPQNNDFTKMATGRVDKPIALGSVRGQPRGYSSQTPKNYFLRDLKKNKKRSPMRAPCDIAR